MNSLSKLLLFLVAAGFLSGCEKQEYFKSESEVKKEISFSWKQVMMSHDTNLVYSYYMWTFKDDKMTIVRKKFVDDASIDTLSGTFKINTTLSKVFVTTSNFPANAGWNWMNAEWTVVALDNKILVVASEDPDQGGINELEFTRID
jgi:hypothetical protein